MTGKGLAALIGVLLPFSSTYAATLSPESAAELLARSDAANAKCHILADSDSIMLATLVDQAEASLVLKVSQAAATDSIASGRKLGASVKCDQTTAAAVRAILDAARMAAVAAVPPLRGSENDVVNPPEEIPGEQTAALPPPDETHHEAETASAGATVDEANIELAPAPPSKHVKLAKRKARPTPAPVKDKIRENNDRLSSYGNLAQRYYLERRCRNVSNVSIVSLYREVLAAHHASVVKFGAQSVSQTQRRAQARAAAKRC